MILDWLKNLRKSAAEKEQEAITAYLDGALSERETAAFEARLRDDANLQSEIDTQRRVKELLAQAPRIKAPRNFVLDPAVYGRQKPQPIPLAIRLYPQLRTATVVASLLFAAVLTLNLYSAGSRLASQDVAMAPAELSEIQATSVGVQEIEEVEADADFETFEGTAADEAAAISVETVAVTEEVEMVVTVEVSEIVVEEEAAEEEAEVLSLEEADATDDEALAESVPEPEPSPVPTIAPAATTSQPVTAGDAAASNGAADGGEDGEEAPPPAADEPPSEPAAEADEPAPTATEEESAVLVAPRATGTPGTSRVGEPEAEVVELTATPAPTVMLNLEDEDASVAAVPEEDVAREAVDTFTDADSSLLGALALFFGAAALILLLVTFWARRQTRL
ncbi:MAG: hypothetical protein QNJ45_02720 [Ardenticatenaceae bacterium]|nr:hypothetical protein [Ardenticatenaceae bacterium]